MRAQRIVSALQGVMMLSNPYLQDLDHPMQGTSRALNVR